MGKRVNSPSHWEKSSPERGPRSKAQPETYKQKKKHKRLEGFIDNDGRGTERMESLRILFR